MLPKKFSPGISLRTSMFVILIVQMIAEICSKPSPVGGRARQARGRRYPAEISSMNGNPFEASDEDHRFQDFLSSEEDFFNSREDRKERGDGPGFDHYIYDPIIEQASLPQLQSMYSSLNKVEPQFSYFQFNSVWSTLFRKCYCFFFYKSDYCVSPNDVFFNEPWFSGFRSMKNK